MCVIVIHTVAYVFPSVCAESKVTVIVLISFTKVLLLIKKKKIELLL